MNKITGKIIGIDLGTTNSVVGYWDGKEAKIIVNTRGKETTPSIVAYTEKGEVLVGEVARNQAVMNPQNTVASAKRLIGRQYDEVKPFEDKFSYKIIKGKNGDARIFAGNKETSPEGISASVLSDLKKSAEAYFGHSISHAVITVPAYFNNEQRHATENAAKIAGLNVSRIINEPTAAALAYGMDKIKTGTRTILIFDLGGGTFDVSLIKIEAGIFTVLSTNGNTRLGGDDFDNVLEDYIIKEMKRTSNIDISNNNVARARVKEQAEAAKKDLSSAEQVTIYLSYISGDKSFQMDLTRAKFNSLIEPLVDSALKPCEIALSDAKLSKTEIDDIILVGGSTRVPLVKEKVKKFFGKEPKSDLNPDLVVAMGAAIQGGIIQGDVTDILLLDVTPLSLGIETQGGIFTKIIEKNTTVPTKKSKVFSTAEDNQRTVSIMVYQGERPMAKDNHELGKFDLSDIPAAPRGVPQIEVEFDIDLDGMVQVTAKDKNTGKQQAIKVKASGLSDEEIKKAQEDFEKNKELDEKKLNLVSAKNEADVAIHQANKAIDTQKDISAEKKEKLEKLIQEVRETLSTENEDEIKSKTKDLNNITSEIMYKTNPNENQTETNPNENKTEN